MRVIVHKAHVQEAGGARLIHYPGEYDVDKAFGEELIRGGYAKDYDGKRHLCPECGDLVKGDAKALDAHVKAHEDEAKEPVVPPVGAVKHATPEPAPAVATDTAPKTGAKPAPAKGKTKEG